jgi:hypothetical protein
VLTTLPYDEGWKIYVDDQQIEYNKALDALIAFDIKGAGEHTVRFKYAPKTFTLGLTVSILSTLLFALIIVLEKPLTAALSTIFSCSSKAEEEVDITENDTSDNKECVVSPEETE